MDMLVRSFSLTSQNLGKEAGNENLREQAQGSVSHARVSHAV